MIQSAQRWTEARSEAVAPLSSDDLRAPTAAIPERRSFSLVRWLKFVIGFAVCAIVMVMPYRVRVAAGERIGMFLNSLYHRYLRLLSWLFRQLDKD
jgi:hypothetical protein